MLLKIILFIYISTVTMNVFGDSKISYEACIDKQGGSHKRCKIYSFDLLNITYEKCMNKNWGSNSTCKKYRTSSLLTYDDCIRKSWGNYNNCIEFKKENKIDFRYCMKKNGYNEDLCQSYLKRIPSFPNVLYYLKSGEIHTKNEAINIDFNKRRFQFYKRLQDETEESSKRLHYHQLDINKSILEEVDITDGIRTWNLSDFCNDTYCNRNSNKINAQYIQRCLPQHNSVFINLINISPTIVYKTMCNNIAYSLIRSWNNTLDRNKYQWIKSNDLAH